MAEKPRGLFISFEGGEGAGKSTQLRLLASRLRDAGCSVVETREPGGSPKAEQLRAALFSTEGGSWPPLAEALIVYAARLDHLESVIRPALARGEIVVTDRFSDSTFAYQNNVGRHMLGRLESWVVGDTRPDATFLLDLPPEIGLARVAERGATTSFDRRPSDFHEKVRARFLEIAAAEPQRMHVVDAARPADAIADEIAETVLGLRDQRKDRP